MSDEQHDYRYSIIPARAITDVNISAQALRVLALLGRHTSNNGWCLRSQVKMAKELGCGRATVQRSLDELVEAEYVEKRERNRPGVEPEAGRHPHCAYSYRVVLDTKDGEGAHARAPRANAAHSEREVPTDGHGVPANSGHGVPISRAPINEPSLCEGPICEPLSDAPAGAREREESKSPEEGNPENSDPESGWPEIFAALRAVPGQPKDLSERKCKLAWGRLIAAGKAPTVDEILRAIAAWAADVAELKRTRKAPGPLLVPEAQNWLRDERFRGYLAAEKAAEESPDPCAAVIERLGAAVVARLRAAGLTDGEINSYFGDAEFDGALGRFVVLSEFKRRQIGDKFGSRLRHPKIFGPALAIIVEGEAA